MADNEITNNSILHTHADFVSNVMLEVRPRMLKILPTGEKIYGEFIEQETCITPQLILPSLEERTAKSKYKQTIRAIEKQSSSNDDNDAVQQQTANGSVTLDENKSTAASDVFEPFNNFRNVKPTIKLYEKDGAEVYIENINFDRDLKTQNQEFLQQHDLQEQLTNLGSGTSSTMALSQFKLNHKENKRKGKKGLRLLKSTTMPQKTEMQRWQHQQVQFTEAAKENTSSNIEKILGSDKIWLPFSLALLAITAIYLYYILYQDVSELLNEQWHYQKLQANAGLFMKCFYYLKRFIHSKYRSYIFSNI